MGKVLWHVTMSLDGFIASSEDAMEWAFEYPQPSATVEKVIETTGALLVGRRTYEVEDRDRRGFYGGAWTGPFFVLTHDAPATVPEWMSGTFLNDGIEDAEARAKAVAGEQNVVILGPNIALQCIGHGLLDEIVINLRPSLLGEGVRFFESPETGGLNLERISVDLSGQITDLRFRVLK